jgi:glycosyltransferase involved in cell wall biosynthesis
VRILHLAYSSNVQQKSPEGWLDRIIFFTGVLEAMAAYAEVININFIGYTGTLVRNRVTHYFFKRNYFQRLLPFRTHSFVRGLAPDVIVVHGLVSPWQVLLLRAQVARETKIVVQHHAEKPLRGIKKHLQRLVDPYISAYFFTSAGLAEPWILQGQIKHTHKIHEVMEVSSAFYPVDRAEALRKVSVKATVNYLWVGRLDRNKDPLTAVNAFTRLLSHYKEATLYLIFQTEELLANVRRMLNDHPECSERIILVGKVAHDELLYWYNAMDFILSTSHYEGSGVAVCEAMSCGCIPILTEIPSFRMMTSQGHCGLLFKPGEVNDLFRCLQQSIEMDIQHERKKVLQQFHNNLSFAAIAKKIYQSVSRL